MCVCLHYLSVSVSVCCTGACICLCVHVLCCQCLCCVCTNVCIRAVRYHPMFAYHNIIVLVSQYTLDIDILHDMAYMT